MSFRATLPLVQGIIAVDPCIARGYPRWEFFFEAMPEFSKVQPRLIPRFILFLGQRPKEVPLLGPSGARDAVGSMKILDPMESLRARPPLRFDSNEGYCVSREKPGALGTCDICKSCVHIACCLVTTPVEPLWCPTCRSTKSKPAKVDLPLVEDEGETQRDDRARDAPASRCQEVPAEASPLALPEVAGSMDDYKDMVAVCRAKPVSIEEAEST